MFAQHTQRVVPTGLKLSALEPSDTDADSVQTFWTLLFLYPTEKPPLHTHTRFSKHSHSSLPCKQISFTSQKFKLHWPAASCPQIQKILVVVGGGGAGLEQYGLFFPFPFWSSSQIVIHNRLLTM